MINYSLGARACRRIHPLSQLVKNAEIQAAINYQPHQHPPNCLARAHSPSCMMASYFFGELPGLIQSGRVVVIASLRRETSIPPLPVRIIYSLKCLNDKYPVIYSIDNPQNSPGGGVSFAKLPLNRRCRHFPDRLLLLLVLIYLRLRLRPKISNLRIHGAQRHI